MTKYFLLLLLTLSSSPAWAAADSYRWFHVSIDQVWYIFIFLLPMVLFPAILMAILYWKYSMKKKSNQSDSKLNDEI
ncbi:MAG: hypothetical protein OEX19_06860 [Gammaproteobacteria bacterium]|nr:hypothetical protein [Gammaproteobacteria bacterium]